MTSPETCDDIVGTPVSGDGCSDACVLEPGWDCLTPGAPCTPKCGDGITVSTDVCDVASGALNGCSGDCTTTLSGFSCVGTNPTVCNTVCGDGLIRGSEVCDDGQLPAIMAVSGDGCSDSCQVEIGFDCGSPPQEPTICSEICDDGKRVGNEVCDDGGAPDGCLPTC